MKKWEYKVTEGGPITAKTDEQLYTHPITLNKLNQLGDQGWEFIYYCPTVMGGPIALFKREKT
jgi:hypothetical protein